MLPPARFVPILGLACVYRPFTIGNTGHIVVAGYSPLRTVAANHLRRTVFQTLTKKDTRCVHRWAVLNRGSG